MIRMQLDRMVMLNNGVQMPVLGLGTWQLNGHRAYDAVREAISMGYRLIDTASMYDNEEEVGRAAHDSGVPREKLFITTKLWSHEHGYREALQACGRSLARLGTGYIDLYLIHWPSGDLIPDTWRAMQDLLAQKKVRAIGVSNFGISDIDGLEGPAPAVNQVELSPYLHDDRLFDHCRSLGIKVEAYSPLTHGRRLEDPEIAEIGAAHSKSAAQVLIRYALQKDTVVIPKASSREHLMENADVFDFSLSDKEMRKLDSLQY